MTFHEVRFPTAVAFHTTGGPERKTEIVALGSGFEERNGVWANSRRRYDVGSGVRTLDDAIASLVSLGDKPAEANRAVDSIAANGSAEGVDLEAIIRKSLAVLLSER